jgi:hypothetical protein
VLAYLRTCRRVYLARYMCAQASLSKLVAHCITQCVRVCACCVQFVYVMHVLVICVALGGVGLGVVLSVDVSHAFNYIFFNGVFNVYVYMLAYMYLPLEETHFQEIQVVRHHLRHIRHWRLLKNNIKYPIPIHNPLYIPYAHIPVPYPYRQLFFSILHPYPYSLSSFPFPQSLPSIPYIISTLHFPVSPPLYPRSHSPSLLCT